MKNRAALAERNYPNVLHRDRPFPADEVRPRRSCPGAEETEQRLVDRVHSFERGPVPGARHDDNRCRPVLLGDTPGSVWGAKAIIGADDNQQRQIGRYRRRIVSGRDGDDVRGVATWVLLHHKFPHQCGYEWPVPPGDSRSGPPERGCGPPTLGGCKPPIVRCGEEQPIGDKVNSGRVRPAAPSPHWRT